MAFDVAKFENLANDAVEQLTLFLKGDISDEKYIKGARVCATLISSLAKYKQHESARDATHVLVARELAKNPEEFKKYIAVAMPNSPFKKLIEKK